MKKRKNEGDTWIDILTSKVWHLKDHWHFVGKKSDDEIRSLEFYKDVNIPCSEECLPWEEEKKE